MPSILGSFSVSPNASYLRRLLIFPPSHLRVLPLVAPSHAIGLVATLKHRTQGCFVLFTIDAVCFFSRCAQCSLGRDSTLLDNI